LRAKYDLIEHVSIPRDQVKCRLDREMKDLPEVKVFRGITDCARSLSVEVVVDVERQSKVSESHGLSDASGLD
jgi:hypothetical protein